MASGFQCVVFSPKDSSSVMECPGEKSQSRQLLETQQSYETEWDMVNAVSFKKKNCTNGEGGSVDFLMKFQDKNISKQTGTLSLLSGSQS